MEYLLAREGLEAGSIVGNKQDGIDSCDGPEPVRTMDTESLVSSWRVDVQSLVAADDETHERRRR